MFKRVVIAVADGARDDLMKRLLESGRLPNIQKHLVERGCYRTTLTVFPSTTGPAHIPFVCGLHPGTANIPGYRWLCRKTHDNRRRSIYRHRSLNSPRGLMVGRDMDPSTSTSIFDHFDKPSSVLELIDYCPNQRLYKVIARRLFHIVQAHRSDDWGRIDRMVERLMIKRIRAGSECVIGSFFGIDEYSHLYDPFDQRTITAYKNIDNAIGNIAATLKQEGIYNETILAVVSDHGLSVTTVHIPLVDIVRDHGFTPFYYPRLYRRKCDSAVLESGNSMAQLYFKRGDRWGEHWHYEEISKNKSLSRLVHTLLNTEGISFVGARLNNNGVIFVGRDGSLRAFCRNGKYDLTVEGNNPLKDHPLGSFAPEELFCKTFNTTYPDAVNQLFMLLDCPRSGDLILSSEPGYDLRLQHEDPEHHGSHGSLHREHMQVPLCISVPIEDEYISNCDLVPTVLALCGKAPRKMLDGRQLTVRSIQTSIAPTATVTGNPHPVESSAGDRNTESKKGSLSPIIATMAIILCGIILTAIFKQDILDFGTHLMTDYGEGWMNLILFVLTAVSSTPLALPIWVYALVGVALGYHILWLAAIMALGSASGSLVTFLLGRYFGDSEWVRKRFPNLHKHPWAHGRSRVYVTLALFLGTASPIPCDIFYVACGFKRYSPLLFWITMVAARFVRYCYVGYGFLYFRDFFDMFI